MKQEPVTSVLIRGRVLQRCYFDVIVLVTRADIVALIMTFLFYMLDKEELDE